LIRLCLQAGRRVGDVAMRWPRWKELASVTGRDVGPVRRNWPVLLRYDVRPVRTIQPVFLMEILGPLERASLYHWTASLQPAWRWRDIQSRKCGAFNKARPWTMSKT